MKAWTRHGLPAVAALSVLLSGPARERFDVIHGLRGVGVLSLAAALMFAGRLARADWGTAEWASAAAWVAMAVGGACALSPAYALAPLALFAGCFAIALGTSWREGERENWLTWLALAAVAVAALGMLESMGLGPQSLRGRAPSSTMGQRNTLAHFLVLASPLVWAQAVRAGSRRSQVAWLFAAALLAAVVVQTRCRAAWGVGPAVLFCFVLLVRTRAALGVAGAVVSAVAIAAVAPVGLRWTEPHPFADTFSRLAEWRTGSGAGRIAEWAASSRLFLEHRLLGIGPGNWFVEYGVAHNGDHFPHADGLALLVERGAIGTGLALTVATAVLHGWKERRDVLGWPLVASTVLAAGALGAFDSVLQLPAPLLWLTLVCFVGLRSAATPVRAPALALALVVLAVGAALSFGSRLLSTSDATPFDRLELAATLDPFDGELRLALAEAWISAGRCDQAARHLEAAQQLLPLHPQLPGLTAACR